MLELLVGALLSAFIGILITGILGNHVYFLQTVSEKLDAETNVRSMMIALEKQIECSDCIIFDHNRCYVRDMESSSYLDYYSLEGINLYKNKVYDNLHSIGLGSKSQMASNITYFQMVPSLDGGVVLSVECTCEQQVYRMTKVIIPFCPVYVFG